MSDGNPRAAGHERLTLFEEIPAVPEIRPKCAVKLRSQLVHPKERGQEVGREGGMEGGMEGWREGRRRETKNKNKNQNQKQKITVSSLPL